jgi:ATP-dependent DNA helicase RecQ
MRDPEVVVTSFNRPNLTYRVVPIRDKKDKLPRILDVVRSQSPGIVYGTTRKECEELAASLKRAGVNAAHYHAGLGAAERSSVQERFMTDEVDVVVATIAFGMGVDKPNVRFVVHASVPGSLPAYIQEAGRAGRDGEPASCVVLYRGADLGRRKRLVTVNAAGAEEASSFFRALARIAGEDGRVNVPPNSLGSLGGVEPDVAGVLLGGLEEAGLLSRGYDLWGEAEVRRVDEEPEGLREEISRVHAALPGDGTIALPELARRAGVRPVVAQTALFRLMADGIVEAVARGSLADVRLKADSLGEGSQRAMAARLKDRSRTAYKQIDYVEQYANLSTCRRERLLRHFGDTEEVAPCGGCDVCLGETGIAEDVPPAMTTAPALLGAHGGLSDGDSGGNGAMEAFDAGLFERLRAWRGDQARSQQVPAYVVLHNSHLEEIARRQPKNVHELGSIKGIGLRRAARYGEEILALVRGEQPAAPEEARSGAARAEVGDFREHLTAAERLIEAGRGAAAVPELARALEAGGEEARLAVDELLASRSGR